jgi:hypothetical protein
MKEAGLFLLSSLKFFLAPALGIAMGFSFVKTVLITTSGGTSSVLFFYYFGKVVIRTYRRIFRKKENPPDKEIVPSLKRRVIIDFKNKYGLNGLAIASPIIISIPVGAVVASRFFKRKRTPLLFILWVVIWSLGLTTIAQLFKENFFTSAIDL